MSEVLKRLATEQTQQSVNTALGGVAKDTTLQATNTALGNLAKDATLGGVAKDATLQGTNTALGNVAKDATLQATNTALGNLGKDTSLQQIKQAILDLPNATQQAADNANAAAAAALAAVANMTGLVCSFIGLSDGETIVYNYGTKNISLPAGFVVYSGRAYTRSAQTIDLTNALTLNEACTLWVKNDKTIYAKKWSDAPDSNGDEFLGYVYRKYVFINGFSGNKIKIVDSNGNNISPYDDNHGSYIGIETEIRKVVYNITTHELVLPGGFKVYRGSTASYSEETIPLVTDTAALKLWMKNDKTVYSTAWTTNTPQARDDDCIGFIYGFTVHINGIPDYCISVIDSNDKQKVGLFFGDAYIGVKETDEVVYDYDNHILDIPAGFSIYRGVGLTRAAIHLDVSEDLLNEACILFMTATRTVYAKVWSSALIENPTDQIVGYIWQKNVFINGVHNSNIYISTATKKVYCFGDSITAGEKTLKAYHMYLHQWAKDYVFYNWGVGSTGYIYETSDNVMVGGGVIGIGSHQQESGNNNILKVMQSVDEDMPNIIIAAGINDYNTSQPISDFRTAVQDVLDYALTKTKQILVLTPIKREGWETTRNSQNLLEKDYADVIMEECESRGIVCADGYDVSLDPSVAGNKTAFVPDGLHPNQSGHAKMARNYFNKFLESVCG